MNSIIGIARQRSALQEQAVAEEFMTDAHVKPCGDHLCSRCPRGEFCLAVGLDQVQAQRLDAVMHISRPLQAKQSLFRAGEPFKALYAVRTGGFKTTAIDCDGYEQVIGFHLPSEMMGFDGLFSGIHQCSASALTVSTVCIFPYKPLLEIAGGVQALIQQLMRLMGKDIVGNMSAIGDYLAEERLAAFLLGLALRVHPRGELNTRIALPMLRADIANHLRLAGETLSRTLSKFQDQGLIALDHRVLHILDLKGLQYVARRVPAVNL